MVRSRAWQEIQEITADQWGLITRAQAEATGTAWSTLARLARTGTLERYAHGVYRLVGAPETDHLALRAAWLQLDPATPAWERSVDTGAVSHRSAAALYGLGDLPDDVHEFTLPGRRQTRRGDVRMHRGQLAVGEWETLSGLPATRPRRIVADLLADGEEPAAVGQIAADTLRSGLDETAALAAAAERHAGRHGFRRGDGAGLLHWMLSLADDAHSALAVTLDARGKGASDGGTR